MDSEWALEELRVFVDLTTLVNPPPTPGVVFFGDETALFQLAFSTHAPAPGKPRLRLPDDDDGKTARGVRRGVMAFAEGCFAAIRNPSSHDVQDDLPEAEALEQLASFSVLARWVDAARVLK